MVLPLHLVVLYCVLAHVSTGEFSFPGGYLLVLSARSVYVMDYISIYNIAKYSVAPDII